MSGLDQWPAPRLYLSLTGYCRSWMESRTIDAIGFLPNVLAAEFKSLTSTLAVLIGLSFLSFEKMDIAVAFSRVRDAVRHDLRPGSFYERTTDWVRTHLARATHSDARRP